MAGAAGAVDALQQVLREGDYETLHSQEATLADIFIRLTGEGLAA